MGYAPAGRPATNNRLRVCLAASGGGHVRQLLDLEPAWSKYDYFFVSENTALSRSIAEKHPAAFVPHFALGQARLGAPLRMVMSGIKSFFASAALMLKRRPQVFITTGAGAVFFSLVWARILGARIIVIESFARFNAPSVFERLAAPLAHEKVIQSRALSSYWPDAAVFDPLRELGGERPPKRPFVFATVGAILPFDRLVNMVAEASARGAIPEDIFVQTGAGGVVPPGIETAETLPFDRMQEHLREADIVVCHGGTGSLITALRQGCRVIAVPRLFELGEVYDNHQAEIVDSFAARGYLLVANTTEELIVALAEARNRHPPMVTSDPSALIDHLDLLLSQWADRKQKSAPDPKMASRSVPKETEAAP